MIRRTANIFVFLVAMCVCVPRALAATVDVYVFNFDFSINPEGQPIADAVINVGDTIRWMRTEGNHTTTSVAGILEVWNGSLSSSTPTFQHTFTQAGTWWYYCIPHGTDNGNGTAGGMSGTITVLPVGTGACCLAGGTCSVLSPSNCQTQGGTYQGNGTTCSPNPCPQPTGACCAASGVCSIVTQASCTAGGGTWQGAGTSCSPNPCPQPTGACCQISGTCTPNVTQAACISTGGTWQGAGVSCTPNPCAEPTGACCVSDGTCSIVAQNSCTTAGGTWQGAGTICSPNPCPQPTGACCMNDGTCSIVVQASCAAASGNWQGAGTICSPNPCPPPTGACCMNDGACSVATAVNCTLAGGTWQGAATTCSPNTCPQPTGACCASNGTCSTLTSAQCAAQGGMYQGDDTECDDVYCSIQLTPFVDPLPIPAVAQPIIGVPGGEAFYEIAIQEVQQLLHSQLPPTTVWGYGGTFPGPTILATTDLPVTVHWINDLRDSNGNLRLTHYLPVDLCINGPDTLGPSARVVSHLHGGHVDPANDGYPEWTLLPGESTIYTYANHQLPATLWYHDHAMGITRLNVIMGLAGFYLLLDEFENNLNLPAGEYQIGLAIQDRQFNPDGSFRYPAEWEEEFFGDKILVNGKVWPYLNVKRGKYRFRMLNGCTSRTQTLALSNGATFHQIGTDGGMLAAPVPMTHLTLMPGERADVVIDFGSYPTGTEIILINSAPAPFPGSPGEGVIPNVMKFIVQGQPGHTAPLPSVLRPLQPLLETQASVTRDFLLQMIGDECTGMRWAINGLHWDDITEFPRLGRTEIWRFINWSTDSHPMHMHLAQFQVLDRQEFEIVNGVPVPIGSPILPPANEIGWKDTVRCDPDQITRVIAKFENYTGLFAYHCHILEHEEHEMMRQMLVRPACAADVAPVAGDDVVNVNDLLAVINGWGACKGQCWPDITGDNVVNVNDLLAVINNWGPCAQ